MELKIERHEPKSVERLAIELAQAFADAAEFSAQHAAYSKQAESERLKAERMRDLVAKLDSGVPREQLASGSRMDPILTYDLDACIVEMGMLQKRANRLHKEADRYKKLSDDRRLEARRLQSEIARINGRAK